MAETPQPTTPNPDRLGPVEAQDADRPVPTWPPPPSSSADDLNMLLSQSTPDPFLADAASPRNSGPAHAGRAPGGTAQDDPPRKREEAEHRSDVIELGSGFVEGVRSIAPGPIGSSGSELVLPIRLSSEELSRPEVEPAATPEDGTADEEFEVEKAGLSWPIILIASYASAVSMALIWLLWTGRGIVRTDDLGVPGAFPVTGRHGSSHASTSSPREWISIPLRNQTLLHAPLRLGDLEVTPLAVAHRSVELVRVVGESEDVRSTDPLLTLTLQFKNLSRTDAFAPLDAFLVRDAAPGPDEPCLELPGGRRIPLYQLSAESEWSIVGQDFPTLRPGKTAETVLATEPIRLSELSDPLIWHVKLRTGPFQTDVLGVPFSRTNIEDQTP